jgi:hypothetical protein
VAVHWEVPRTTTSVGVQETVIEGVVVELEPQELRITTAAVSPKQKRTRSQRTLPRHKRKFRSSTRNPPARTTLIFLRKMQILPMPRTCPDAATCEGTPPLALLPEKLSNLPVNFLPLGPCVPLPLNPHVRTPATNLIAIRLGFWAESHSPRGIDAVPHPCVACTKAECDNRPSAHGKVKRNLRFLPSGKGVPRSECAAECAISNNFSCGRTSCIDRGPQSP